MSQDSKSLTELLQNTRCTDILKGQKMIEIDASDSISKGCQVEYFYRLIFRHL